MSEYQLYRRKATMEEWEMMDILRHSGVKIGSCETIKQGPEEERRAIRGKFRMRNLKTPSSGEFREKGQKQKGRTRFCELNWLTRQSLHERAQMNRVRTFEFRIAGYGLYIHCDRAVEKIISADVEKVMEFFPGRTDARPQSEFHFIVDGERRVFAVNIDPRDFGDETIEYIPYQAVDILRACRFTIPPGSKMPKADLAKSCLIKQLHEGRFYNSFHPDRMKRLERKKEQQLFFDELDHAMHREAREREEKLKLEKLREMEIQKLNSSRATGELATISVSGGLTPVIRKVRTVNLSPETEKLIRRANKLLFGYSPPRRRRKLKQ